MQNLSSLTIKPVPSGVEVWSLNHWTTREVPKNLRFEIKWTIPVVA